MGLVVAVIPARMGSTRLPGKPLLSRTGRPLIQHVLQRVSQARLIDRAIVATDDDRIAQAVRSVGAEAAMTRPDHPSGTDRVAEVARSLPEEVELILNIQGDEPEMDPSHLDALVAAHRASGARMSTLACPFPAEARVGLGSPLDPNRVKVVLRPAAWAHAGLAGGWAVMFTRSLCPYPRDDAGQVMVPAHWRLHLGVYGFDRSFLQAFTAWPPSALEEAERLEQLRALEHGEPIAVALVDRAAAGVDTPEDYERFVQRWTAQAPEA